MIPALNEDIRFDVGAAELHALIRVAKGQMTHRQLTSYLRSERWPAEDAGELSDLVRQLAEVRMP